MSRRTVEANKAIRLAWEREFNLVSEGKGTRDWTEKQQMDILDPNKGKAYDDEGRAFEGQHMKSAEMYPEYQGDPNNIQFLTRSEHLEAHNGSWQNPTNWYFNPVTKEKINFGDGPYISCDIIQLTKPIVNIKDNDLIYKKENVENKVQSDRTNNTLSRKSVDCDETYKKQETLAQSNIKVVKTKNSVLFSKLKSAGKSIGKLIVDHPVETFEVVTILGKVVSTLIHSGGSDSSCSSTSMSNLKTTNAPSVVEKVKNIVEEEVDRNLPSENDVSEHRQRYHTNDGIIWKDIAPYHRGGKD